MTRHSERLTGWRAWLVWAVVLIDLALSVIRLVVAPPSAQMEPPVTILFIVMAASFGLVGALVVTRQPRNPVGWILWLAATAIALLIVSDYATYRATSDAVIAPWIVAVNWVSGFVFLPTIGMIVVYIPMLFPDGRLLSPRWRWLAALAAVGLIVAALPSMFMPGPLASGAPIQNPFGIPWFETIRGILDAANVLIVLIAFPLAVAASVIRYRRGSLIEREQLKWFAASAGTTAVWLTLAVLQIEPLSDLGWILGLLGLITLPVAIGIAILRYRLYDIDRIISRTIGYLIVTGVLAVVFVGAILVFTAVLSPVFGENPVAVAASTLIVAALFQPLRRRVQRAVDRRFNRARYDAQRTAEAFAGRLRDQVDLTTVAGDLVTTVDASLNPTSSAVWLRQGGST